MYSNILLSIWKMKKEQNNGNPVAQMIQEKAYEFIN